MPIIDTKQQVYKGNSYTAEVWKEDEDGLLVPFVSGDVVTFTVRKTKVATPTIQKVVTSFVDGKATINVEPTLNEIEAGEYGYTVEYRNASSSIKQNISTGIYEIVGDY